MLAACMAGPLDTGQKNATHILFNIIPLLIYHLVYLVLPEDPMPFCFLAKTITKTSTWRFRGHPHGARPKRIICFKKPKKKLISKMQATTIKQKILTYLVPALFATLKVGCCVKHKLRRFLRPIQREGEDVHLAAANDQAELMRQNLIYSQIEPPTTPFLLRLIYKAICERVRNTIRINGIH